MKRLAAIAVIVALVLTMSVSTAFASTCVGMVCSPTAWTCSESGTSACPMDVAPQGATFHETCRHDMEREAKVALGAQPTVEPALAATPLVTPIPVLPQGAPPVPATPDARGAPHLTTVIRI